MKTDMKRLFGFVAVAAAVAAFFSCTPKGACVIDGNVSYPQYETIYMVDIAGEVVDSAARASDGDFRFVYDKVDLMPQMVKLNDLGFDEVVPVSARTGKNMEVLWKLIAEAMPEGPQYFPDDMITDQPEQILVGEIIREKALRNLSEEIPHGVGVEMLSMKKMSDRLTEIHANVYCEKESHKSIIIGKHAAMLKKIGSEARYDIERLLGVKVMLQLWVKVREDWRNKPGDLKTLGYVKEE